MQWATETGKNPTNNDQNLEAEKAKNDTQKT
jgi:hypothetical protein